MSSDMPKFPNCRECELWNEEERCEQRYGHACPKDKWAGEAVEALEKRMVKLVYFCQNPHHSPSDFVACLAIQRNLLLKEILEALKGAGEQPK